MNVVVPCEYGKDLIENGPHLLPQVRLAFFTPKNIMLYQASRQKSG